ncbi:alkanesulfonate monooxygenase SsuD/methylene tetrahydromethanopterin reductase-like flavin-dependent oxidoreductase (luciferase family) [Saccharothrix tamanrassetensis]|uniref:Alkanesulfonate monooxygenase SsuD/methylene tetrahydromethanopterin reductase-like flavin-dependent oxidoreductase (Luciferase family) n=1 Tax=Saccharothrix tamanrassetensis TaxID=1051531 RepID=A0A841CMD2_9PSEU|nr:LLM class flavin-dependent oxidoreductase [Saccharothrix tamanrassetensis]MBB5958093.1 alkanesulfonate monooxygenase SsuD/methylene tetrahydromethanopterin reductase-like flavin-dependent oxidoreductase (luciferase family) [Saccharothrix tamanrassetensis]
MRAGITILPEYRWAEAKPRWQAAEDYGFAHAWTFDHVGWRTLVDGPWFGSVPTLALAAEATSRIELGMMVASPNFRHPVPFARELITLDDVSDGRFTLGVGAGGMGGYDQKVFGGTNLARSPATRYAEFVELLDALLTRDHVTWSGEYYRAEDARNPPGCVQRPRLPFVVAANGPKALRLAARFGQGWITTGAPQDSLDSWWSSIAELSQRFDETLDALDRPRDEVRRFLQTDAAPVFSLSGVEVYRDFLGRAEALGFTDVAAPWPRGSGVFAGDEGILERVASEVLPGLDP